MTKKELLIAIKDNNIPEDIYDFNNGHGYLDDQFLLNKENNLWKIFYLERGKRNLINEYENEEKANAEFFKLISQY